MTRRLWFMIACGVLVVLIANGLRMTFGVFLKPVSLDLGISRETFGLVLAGQTLLYGVFQPAAGLLADRYGATRAVLLGAGCYILGLVLASQAASVFDLHLSLGLLLGLGLSGCANVVVLGAIGKVVPPERRGMAFGVIIAAGSVGMFMFVPAVQGFIADIGWRPTLTGMAFAIAPLAILAFGLRAPAGAAAAGATQPFGEAAEEARRHRGYVLLTLGFFVCGFHVTFIGAHFPAFLADSGVSETAASYAFGVIGLCNVLGAYLFGLLGDRYRKKSVLTLIYFLRAVLMTALLVLPLTDVTAIGFGVCMGLLWLATVPLTSGIVAQIFGPQHFSFLFGVVFMSHQIGGFVGAWLGGRIYDATGSYDLMWAIAIALGLASAFLHWPINDAPLARTARAAA